MPNPTGPGNGLPTPSARPPRAVVLSTFPGFDDLTANFVLTPNQFLDLCVPHCSRGVVRIVAYLLRQTLGWLDKQGQPLHEQVNVSYTQLIQRAGVSRGALPTALAEAERLGFIRCVRPGQPKRAGQAAVAALYELKWSDSHTHSLDDFEGFYAGSGHRTPVPNQFFDVVVPHEPLAVVKVVGSVLRHTVGFENRYGGRRQEAPLSYTRISTHARLARSTLASAMAHALNHRYIRRVSTGYLRPGTSEFEASVYGVRWASDEPDEAIGSKIEPGPSIYRFKNRTGKKPPERFRNRTGIGSEIEPGNGFKNRTDRNTSKKQPEKQQQQPAAAVAILIRAGFDQVAAESLAERFPLDRIERQVTALPNRNARSNPLGLLRRSIEENWSIPEPIHTNEASDAFCRGFYAGYARLDGESVASPTAQDQDAATAALAALAPDAGESEATEIGRRFGRWYRAEIEDRPPRRLSVADALRTHGDRFRERIAATKKVGTSQPAMPGEAELESQWLAYVERVEAKFRSEQPEPHSLFLARRAERREQMQASRIFRNRPEMLAQALAYHDSDEGRLRGFAKDCGRIVLPFDQWRVRRTHNQQAS